MDPLTGIAPACSSILQSTLDSTKHGPPKKFIDYVSSVFASLATRWHVIDTSAEDGHDAVDETQVITPR